MDIRIRNMDDAIHRKLKVYCAADGISIEAQVKQLIALYVKEREAKERGKS